MTALELMYQLGTVDDKYVLETAQAREAIRHRPKLRRGLLIAAVIAAALLLAGCAAAVLLNLNAMRLGQWQPVKPDTIDAYGDPVPTEVPRDVLTLQGTAGSPNYLAAKEWFDFTESYDPDYEKLRASNDFRPPDAYYSYGCYTQEMIDKVDEICAKYGLELLGARAFDENEQTFFDALGIPGIHREGAVSQTSERYCYPSGSFGLMGNFTLPGTYSGTVYYYGYGCSMKSVFDSSMLYLEDLQGYSQWNYTTSDGQNLLLAQKGGHALIIADRADSFISVSIRKEELVDPDRDFVTLPEGHAFLETVAETFDFSFQTHPVDMEAANARMEAQIEEAVRSRPKPANAEESKRLKALRDSSASYGEYLKFHLDNAGGMIYEFPINPGIMTWAEQDMNGDGQPELLLAWNGQLYQILTLKDGKVVQLCDMGIPLRLYEGNLFGEDNRQSLKEHFSSYTFYRLEGGELVTVQYIHYNEEKGSWYKMPEGDSPYYTAITEEEKDALLASFRPLELEMRPLEEYPME